MRPSARVTLLIATLLTSLHADAFPDVITARQGRSLDGGMTAWAVECTNCAGGAGGSGGSSGGGTIDGGFVGVSSLPLVFIADAGVLNVNFPATQPVSIATMPSTPVTGTFWQATQPVSGTVAVSNFPATQPVSLASAPTTPITAATLPLPAGAATDATLSGLLDGGVGLLSTIVANQTNGQRTTVIMMQYPLNPFLPRCNPVRRTGCQP